MVNFEKKYCDFSIDELVMDHDFCDLVKNQKTEFARLLDQYPEQNAKFNFASRIILGFPVDTRIQPLDTRLRIWEQIINKNRITLRLHIFKYAAVVLMVLGLTGGYFYWQSSSSPEILEFAKQHPAVGPDAQLILSNGKNYHITSGTSKIENINNGEKIAVNDTVVLAEPISEQKGYNQLIIPFGKRSNIVLSDGTKVNMNSGSRLVYPVRFVGGKREVFLEGEAFFEVSKDIHKPFIVQTEGFQLQVLGTKFNVQAYNSENVYNAVLVEGSVKLATEKEFFSKPVVIVPNQIASISADKKSITVGEVTNMQNYISWIQGHLDFKNEKFGILLKRISRYYNIRIDYLEDLNQSIYISGKLDLKEEPERVLDGLSIMANIRYKKEGGKYIFIK